MTTHTTPPPDKPSVSAWTIMRRGTGQQVRDYLKSVRADAYAAGLAARGGDTTDTLRAAVEALIAPGVLPDGEALPEWVHVDDLRAALDAAPAPTDNQPELECTCGPDAFIANQCWHLDDCPRAVLDAPAEDHTTDTHAGLGWQVHAEHVEITNRQRLHDLSVIDELKLLLRRACEANAREDCWLDHNGGCQAHGFLSEPCPYPLIRQYLRAVVDGPTNTNQERAE